MERKILQPGQILVPGEYKLGNEGILKIYFRIFDSGHGDDLPLSIVINRNLATEGALESFVDQDRAQRIYSEIEQSGADYFLIDGNHKTVAAALCHVAPNVLELETNQDLEEARKMVVRGKLFDFPHKKDDLIKIADSFVEFVFRKDYVRTLPQRVDELTSNGDLPQYMKERYHRGK